MPPFCPSTTSRALYELERYDDHFEAVEHDRLEYQSDRADQDAEDRASEEAAERLEWQRRERDATLERWKREERASEPYFSIRPLKRRRARQDVAA